MRSKASGLRSFCSTSSLFLAMAFAAVLFYTQKVFAAEVNVSPYSAADMIRNIVKQLPDVTRLVTAFAYVAGMVFVLRAVVALKHAGEMRTMMSQEHSMKRPMIFMFVGVMLLYLPSAVQTGLSTFWTEPNPYGYLEKQDEWAQFYNACFMIVQLVGVIAFIRGMMQLTQLAGHGGHQGAFGKAMAHIIGGIFCINIYQFVQVVMVTLGLESPL